VPKRGIGLGPVGPEAKKWLEFRGIGLGPRRPGAKRGPMASVPLTTEAIGFI